jgi:hypothetical protein
MMNRCECNALAAFARQGIVERKEQEFVVWNPSQGEPGQDLTDGIETPLRPSKETMENGNMPLAYAPRCESHWGDGSAPEAVEPTSDNDGEITKTRCGKALLECQ